MRDRQANVVFSCSVEKSLGAGCSGWGGCGKAIEKRSSLAGQEIDGWDPNQQVESSEQTDAVRPRWWWWGGGAAPVRRDLRYLPVQSQSQYQHQYQWMYLAKRRGNELADARTGDVSTRERVGGGVKGGTLAKSCVGGERRERDEGWGPGNPGQRYLPRTRSHSGPSSHTH